MGPERDYSLTVTATDGAETPLSAQRSGVSSLVATLDGSPMTDGADNTPCTQAQGSCQRTITPKLSKAQIANLTDGSTHTVSIVAKDALGNLSDPTAFSFRVDKGRPTIQASGRLYDARTDSVGPDDGDYGLSVAATDGSTTPTTAQRSGVVEVTATLDNAPTSGSPKAASCTQTGYSCQLTLPTALTMEQIDNLDPGAHTIAMTATDAAGNKSDPLSFAFTYDEGKVVTAGAETPAPSGEFTTPASCETSAPTQPDVVALTSALTQTLAQATQTVQSALPNANALSNLSALLRRSCSHD